MEEGADLKQTANAAGAGVPSDQPAVTKSPDQSSMSPKSKKSLIMAIIVVVTLAAGAAAYLMVRGGDKTAQTRTVKIGVIGPFTGDTANYGEVMKNGLAMAQRDFNKEGLTIQLIQRDTQCDADKAKAAAEDLVQQGVIAIIGEVCSSASLGALPVANANKVLLMSPSSSSPELTIANDFFFRTNPTDTYQGVLTANLMQDKAFKKVAIMYSDESYGSGLRKVATENLQKLGLSVVADIVFKTGDTDFKAKLTEVKAAGPDALYIATNSVSAAAAIVVQARDMGLTVPLYGADALKDDSFLADIGEAGEGMIVLSVSPGTSAFLDEYKAVYGVDQANATASESYDAYMALAQAIAGGAQTGEDLREALPGISFSGKSGEIKFDASGDLVGGDFLVYAIKDKAFVLQDQ